MNGVHDMGGMHGMGPIQVEENEPVFHESWEATTYALNRAMSAWRRWNIDTGRHRIEQIPPADYLQMSYYERWFVRLESLLIESGLVTPGEVESGKPDPGSPEFTPALSADMVVSLAINSRIDPDRDPDIPARFEHGQRVLTRNMNPTGHTRLPRYARGKTGIIERDHGVHVFPDTNAHGLGEKQQHVYSVRFSARELWGDDASSNDYVYIDLWDDYLEPA